MKTIAQAALDALEDGSAIVSGAVEILATEPIRVWSGLSTIPLGIDTYTPLGDRDIGIVSSAAIGAVAQNLDLTLSGIEPEVLELLDAAGLRGAPVTVYSLIFDQSGTTLLDYYVHRRGRVDRVVQEETSGGTATITVQVESAGRGLGRKTGRLRADTDQRLITSTDGGFRMVSFAAQKTLYWGGRRPSNAGSSLPSGGAVSPYQNFVRRQ